MRSAILLLTLTVGGCAGVPQAASGNPFFDRLSTLCGRAFEGRITSPPVEADRDFADKWLIMHVRDCTPDAIRIPFHAGENRSRTWIVSRSGSAVRLKHDHRHEDGSEDVLTQYGGDSDALTPTIAGLLRHEFPADRYSKDLFTRQNASVSVTNVWALEFTAARGFAYELRRPGRFFRVEFDLARPVAPPPPPWGSR